MAIDLEESSQLAAEIAAAVAVGSERDVAAADVRTNLFGESPDVIGRRDAGALTIPQTLLDIREAWFLFGMQEIPALRRDAVALERVKARYAPDVAAHVPLVGEQIGAGENFAQYRARSE